MKHRSILLSSFIFLFFVSSGVYADLKIPPHNPSQGGPKQHPGQNPSQEEEDNTPKKFTYDSAELNSIASQKCSDSLPAGDVSPECLSSINKCVQNHIQKTSDFIVANKDKYNCEEEGGIWACAEEISDADWDQGPFSDLTGAPLRFCKTSGTVSSSVTTTPPTSSPSTSEASETSVERMSCSLSQTRSESTNTGMAIAFGSAFFGLFLLRAKTKFQKN